MALRSSSDSSFPNNWEAKLALITLLRNHRDITTTEAEIRKELEGSPEHKELYFLLASLYVNNGNNDKAIALLEEVLRKNMDERTSLNARLFLANIYFLQDDKSMAEKLVDEVLLKDASNTEALFVHAQLSSEQGDYQRTVSDLRAIIRDKPRTTKAFQLLAETFFNQGHINLAIDMLNQLLAIDLTDWNARILLAHMHELQGNTRQALEILDIVTKSAPTYPAGWENTTRVAINAKNWPLAEESVKKLDLLDGQHMAATYFKAQILTNTNKKEGAIPLYKQVIDADPSAPLSRSALLELVNVAKSLKRLPEVSTYIAGLKSDSGVVSSIYGEVLLAMGKIDEAAQAFDQAIERKVTVQDPYLNRAAIFVKDRQLDMALQTLKKAEAIAPADIRAEMMTADILSSQGKFAEVISIYDKLLAHNSALDIAANNLAQTIADNQNNDSVAMEKAQLAAERFINSTNPYFLDTLGWVYFRQGKITQAQPILERAIKTATPVLPQMQYHYGSLLLEAGRIEEAKVALSKAVIANAKYPGHDEAEKLLRKTR